MTKDYEIQSTKEYDKFVILDANRSIQQSHVAFLVESIGQDPESLKLRPVLVNERMEVIDGQHRLKAAEKLGVDVYYMIAPGIDISTAQKLNAGQKNWTPFDYAQSYMKTGNKVYESYLTLAEEFNLPHNTLLAYMSGIAAIAGGTGGAHSSMRRFKLGKFTYGKGMDEISTRGNLKLLFEVDEEMPGYAKRRGFSIAFLRMIQHPDYDHEHFLGNISRLQDKFLTRENSVLDNLRALEATYNDRVPFDTQLRLF